MSNFTKKAITDSFIKILSEKPLDKISVKDIIEDCGINRSTFYYYYEDMYALVEDLFTTEIDKIVQKHKQYYSWQDGFIESAEFILKDKKAVYHIYNSKGREHFERYLYKITESLMISYVNNEKERCQLIVSDDDISFIATFYQCALSGFIMNWIQNGMKQDYKEHIYKLGKIFDGSIKNALENCASQKL